MKKPRKKIEREKKYARIRVPKSWTKGDANHIYMDEIIVRYSLN